MTFVLDALRESPTGLFQMDDTTPLQDYSGAGIVATTTGTIIKHPSLSKGATYASVFSNSATATYACPVFAKGYESDPFTLEGWVSPINKNSLSQPVQPYRENLITGSSFELDSNADGVADGWTNYTSGSTGTVTRQIQTSPATAITNGTKGQRVIATALGTTQGDRAGISQIVQNVKPNTLYTFSLDLYFFNLTTGKQFKIYIDHGNSSGQLMGTHQFANNSPGRKSFSFTTPANTARSSVYIWCDGSNGGTATGIDFVVDSVMYTEGTSAVYFDGSSPGWEWTGTANASTSRTRTNVARVNMARNASAEANNGWNSNNGAQYTVVKSTAVKRTGTQSVRAEKTPGSNSLSVIASIYGVGTNGGQVRCFAGDVITYSVYVNPGQAGYKANCVAINYDAAGVSTPNVDGPDFVCPANTWTRISMTWTVAAGTYQFHPMAVCKRIDLANAPELDFVYFDDALIERSSAVNPYFDGSSSGAAFVGSANNSESMLYATAIPQKLLSHTTAYDGITISENTVKFRTEYVAAPAAECSYDLQIPRAFHVAAVHTSDKNSLYIDGVLVSETNLTETQQADSYLHTSTNLISGTTTGPGQIAMNGVAFYPKALTAEAIARHYLEGRNLPDNSQVVDTFFGDVTPVALNGANVFLDQWWSSEEDWSLGKMNNAAVVDGRLTPQFVGDTSVSGSWLDSFSLNQAEATSIFGVNLNWDGEGVTIEVSLDGTTWETAVRGKNVALIPSGFNPTDKVLQVRASFPGGIVNDTSFLDNLNVVGLKTAATPEAVGRTVTYTSATPEREYPILQFNNNWGAQVEDGGSLVISADTLEATPVRTLELWIKATGSTAPTFSITGTNYLNGTADASALTVGAWTLVHIVAAADVAGTVTINGPAQVGQVAIYDYALTAQNVADIYSSYVGANAQRVADNSVLTVSELATAAKIYAHDWAITGAG